MERGVHLLPAARAAPFSEKRIAVMSAHLYTDCNMSSFAPRVAALGFVAVSLLVSGCQSYSAGAAGSGVKLTDVNGAVRVEIHGQHFTDYHYKDVSRPYLYPILGPGGVHMTRRWPQEDVIASEERDHPHHHALWWSHGDANGQDFWSETDKAGRTIHQTFVQKTSGASEGSLTTRNEWRAKDGHVVATDERTIRFHASPPEARVVDFEVTVIASHGDLVLGDTKEGTMAIRVPESMRVKQPKNKPGEGHIVLAGGAKDGDAWGKRGEWCDYYGPAEGRTVGIAILDHPSNPRHPTWWHVRDYGLFAANPFGLHDFEKKAKGAGDMKIAAGSRVTFKYRFIFHDGDTAQGRVAERFAEYAKGRK